MDRTPKPGQEPPTEDSFPADITDTDLAALRGALDVMIRDRPGGVEKLLGRLPTGGHGIPDYSWWLGQCLKWSCDVSCAWDKIEEVIGNIDAPGEPWKQRFKPTWLACRTIRDIVNTPRPVDGRLGEFYSACRTVREARTQLDEEVDARRCRAAQQAAEAAKPREIRKADDRERRKLLWVLENAAAAVEGSAVECDGESVTRMLPVTRVGAVRVKLEALEAALSRFMSTDSRLQMLITQVCAAAFDVCFYLAYGVKMRRPAGEYVFHPGQYEDLTDSPKKLAAIIGDKLGDTPNEHGSTPPAERPEQPDDVEDGREPETVDVVEEPPADADVDAPVILNGLEKPPIVLGKEKPVLKPSEYRAVKALLDHRERGGDETMNKDSLAKEGGGGARRTLKKLGEADPDWKQVIEFPGTGHSTGYRIIAPQADRD